MGISVSCKDLSKDYISSSGRIVQALSRVNFSVEAGEFLSVVGPSGSGKSTLLRVVAGIERYSAGTLVFEKPRSEVRIGMVFQGNSVFPWRTVERNLTYALEASGLAKKSRHAEAAKLCKWVGLDPDVFLQKYPRELSGGETRRLAIGMILGAKVNILLFDEPTSQLDYVAKLRIGQTVQELWRERGFTAIYVTHDIDEAILLGDRVLILDGGQVKGEFRVGLPRPRNSTTLAATAFTALRQEVLTCFGS